MRSTIPGLLLISLLVASLGCTDNGREVRSDRAKMGKPSAPIDISYTVPGDVGVGTSAEVVVTFRLRSPADGLELVFEEGRGLRIDSEETTFIYGPREDGTSISEKVTVTPEVEGVVYLNVFVSGTFDGRAMTRTGAVPVGSGERRLDRPVGVVRTGADGEKILEIPLTPKEE